MTSKVSLFLEDLELARQGLVGKQQHSLDNLILVRKSKSWTYFLSPMNFLALMALEKH